MFTQIIRKQIELNNAITLDWRSKDWELAIITECAETIDSTAWKWWKAGSEDIDNLKVEAIDLLHFIISYGLSRLYSEADGVTYPINDLNETLIEEWEIAQDDVSVNNSGFYKTDLIKFLLNALLSYQESPSTRFSRMTYQLFALILSLGMDAHEVRAMYMAKNLLNEYRQARGYKDPNSNYQKIINGVEDNAHFFAFVRELGHNHPDLKLASFEKMDNLLAFHVVKNNCTTNIILSE